MMRRIAQLLTVVALSATIVDSTAVQPCPDKSKWKFSFQNTPNHDSWIFKFSERFGSTGGRNHGLYFRHLHPETRKEYYHISNLDCPEGYSESIYSCTSNYTSYACTFLWGWWQISLRQSVYSGWPGCVMPSEEGSHL